MKYVLFLIAILFSNQAVALNCAQAPDCAELGYSNVDDPNCKDDGYLICPFDSDYKKCVELNCQGLGYTQSDKSGWCGDIAYCQTDARYSLCKSLQTEVSCKIGDVYYADGSCGNVNDYTSDSGKTPVGVVYWVSDEGKHGKVINLKDLGRESENAPFDPANPYDTSYSKFKWGVYGKDISIKNWYCSDVKTAAKTEDHDDAFWSAGKEYTEIIAKAQSSDLQYAAPATLAFYPPEVSEDDPNVGAGHWYLPTLGELRDLYGYSYHSIDYLCTMGELSNDGSGNTKATVNATLKVLKNKSVTAEELTKNRYWSSSEINRNDAWAGYMNGFKSSYYDKTATSYVRASLQF